MTRQVDAEVREERLAFVIPSFRGGGAERVIITLSRLFSEAGNQVDLVVLSNTGPLRDLVSPAVRVISLDCSRVLTSIPSLYRYFKTEKPTVCLSGMHDANMAVGLALLARPSQTRHFARVQSTLSKALSMSVAYNALTKLISRKIYPRASGVIAVSRGVANDMIECGFAPASNVHVIYSPTLPDLPATSQQRPRRNEGKKKILGVGRLTSAKGFGTLIEAVTAVSRELDVELVIVGEGPERKNLLDLAMRLGIADRVHLPGFSIEPFRAHTDADLFVLSSIREGLPNVLIEALAHGLPVVSTDCPNGPREILDGGRLGRLVGVGNSEELSRAIIDTIHSPLPTATSEDLFPFTEQASFQRYDELMRSRNLPPIGARAR